MVRPYVISTSPADGATGVNVMPTIFIVFNTDMAVETINADNIQLGVPIKVSYYALTRTAEIVPLQPLEPLTQYVLTVKGDDIYVGNSITGVTDILGVPMLGDFTFTFTTGEAADETGGDNIEPPQENNYVDTPFGLEYIAPAGDAGITDGRFVLHFTDAVQSAEVYVIKKDNI